MVCRGNHALPEEFIGYDENGVNDCTESRNRRIPQYCRSCWSLLTAGGTRDSVRVVEADGETTPRSMKGGVDGTEERVLSLRTETLRGEIHGGRMSN